MDLEAYLAASPLAVETLHIGIGDAVIALHVRRLDRPELEALYRAANTKRVRDPETGRWRTELDPERLRTLLIERALVGWDGITYAIAAQLANRKPATGPEAPQPDAPVPFSAQNAQALFARVLNLETELWRELTRAVERRELADAEEKKT